MMQVPEIEQFATVEQPLRAHQLERLFGEREGGYRGLVLLEQRAALERLEGGRRDEAIEDGVIENRAFAHRVGLEPDQVVLEEREEQVAEQRVEMRHEAAAGLDQLADRGRAQPDIAPGAAIVAVAFDPRRAGRHDRDVQAPWFGRLFRHRRDSQRSTARSI